MYPYYQDTGYGRDWNNHPYGINLSRTDSLDDIRNAREIAAFYHLQPSWGQFFNVSGLKQLRERATPQFWQPMVNREILTGLQTGMPKVQGAISQEASRGFGQTGYGEEERNRMREFLASLGFEATQRGQERLGQGRMDYTQRKADWRNTYMNILERQR